MHYTYAHLSILSGTVHYDVIYQTAEGVGENMSACSVSLLDVNDTSVATSAGCSGSISLINPNLWWPYLMHDNPGYQYTLWASIYQ